MNYLETNRIFVILLFVMAPPIISSGQVQTNRPEFKEHTFHSKILNEDRTIVIYKPVLKPQFSMAVSPIIYVLDGGQFADVLASYVNLYCEKFSDLPAITVVGISNFEKRGRDYRPLKARGPGQEEAGADKFLDFLTKEVMPQIEGKYKTPPYRVIAGHSFGGLMVMHLFSHYPKLFRAGIASSPYMADNGNAYMGELVDYLKISSGNQRSLFFSVANEGPVYLHNAEYIDSLLNRQKVAQLSHLYQHYPDENHSTVIPRALFAGFKYAFHLKELNHLKQRPFAENYEIVQAYHKSRTEIFGPIPFTEDLLNGLGYQYLDWKDIDNALQCFKKNTELFPTSGFVWDSYAEGFMEKGDKKNAILYYEKSLSLDPNNDNAKLMLSKLKK
ncbi:MAG: prolyl oligopeptidase family serine peptidase [Cyclobacteriaceae bacterium]|nr:prolyl oligopeptidase family serine peptidase [Cyclobacteriaceae bacterium]